MMRGAIVVCKRELHSFFVTPVAYGVVSAFVFLAAFFFFNYFSNFNRALAEHAAISGSLGTGMNLNDWVIEVYYHSLVMVMVFMVPLLAMRSFAGERRQGTFELLMTSPLTAAEIVWGKYLALFSITVLMVLCSLFFPLLLCLWGQPGPELLPIISGGMGLLLCGAAFCSVALGAGAWSDNQVVAGLSAWMVLLMLYVIFWPAQSLGGYGEDLLRALSPVWQVNDLIEGVVTLSGMLYFASLIAAGLFLAIALVDHQRRR